MYGYVLLQVSFFGGYAFTGVVVVELPFHLYAQKQTHHD